MPEHDAQKLFNDGFIVRYDFDIDSTANGSYGRSGSYGLSDPLFTWSDFITGVSPGMNSSDSVKNWYEWGCRKYWLHSPFGVLPSDDPYAIIEFGEVQVDQYICALNGLTHDSDLQNNPTTWITDNFVDTWKALITGSQGNLSNSIWEEWTNESTGWFDPSSPIQVTSCLGSFSSESSKNRWNLYFNQDESYAINRLKESYLPIMKSGMRIAIDDLFAMSSSIVDRHVPIEHINTNSQVGWWKFFTWLEEKYSRRNIFCGGYPIKIERDSVEYDNPYLGCSIFTDEWMADINSESLTHVDGDLGRVNLIKSFKTNRPLTKKPDNSNSKYYFLSVYESATPYSSGLRDGYSYVPDDETTLNGSMSDYGAFAFILNKDSDQEFDSTPEKDITTRAVLVPASFLRDHSPTSGYQESFQYKFTSSIYFVNYLDWTYDNDDYDPTQYSTSYASISLGFSNVIFYTTTIGEVKYIIGKNGHPDFPDEQNAIGAGITNCFPNQDGTGGQDLTPPADIGLCKKVVTGYRFAAALKLDDSIVAWGRSSIEENAAYFMQQLRYYQQPSGRLFGVKITKISAGADHILVLLSNGEVVAFGSNAQAALSDQNTVFSPIGVIPRPIDGDANYITNWQAYGIWEYAQNKSSLFGSLSLPDTGDPNQCVTRDELQEAIDNDLNVWRVYRGNYVGCNLHEGLPQGNYDTPYVIGNETYPIPDNGSYAWGGNVNWALITGAPNDYQFARYTTGITDGINFSFNGGWIKSTDRIPMCPEEPYAYLTGCTTSTDDGYDRECNGDPNCDSTPGNSVFGISSNKYTDIAAGRSHNLLLTEDGTIETWGWNFYYMITGSGPQPNSWSRAGSGIPGGQEDSAGWATDGHPRPFPDAPWGDNTHSSVKIFKTEPGSVAGIGAGYYTSYVIREDGSLFAWDRNEWGETSPRLNSDQTPGLPSGTFIQVDGGYHHAIALRENGTVVCWGENNDGECDVPDILKSSTSGCVWVGCFARMSFALRSNGELWGWGNTDEPTYNFIGFTSGTIFNPDNPILIGRSV